MKISYVSPLPFGERGRFSGAERYPLSVARGVVAAARERCDVEVEVVAFGAEATLQPMGRGVIVRVLPFAAQPRHPLDGLSWDLAAALHNAHVVHVHQPFTRPGEIALVAAKQQRKVVCTTDHGGRSTSLGASYGSLDLADQVICNSDFAATLLHTSSPISVIKGGVDATFFSPSDQTPARDHVLFVGQVVPHKGIDRLIAAMPQELPLTVCGPADTVESDYLRLLRAVGRTKQVTYVCDADDETLRDLYHRAWATVLPSVYRDTYGTTVLAPELMGLSLLESMACATPAICSRVGGMPEFVDHGVTGFVFDSLAQLQAQLRQLSHDPALADRMGSAARTAIESQYASNIVGTKLLAIYDRLLTRVHSS